MMASNKPFFTTLLFVLIAASSRSASTSSEGSSTTERSSSSGSGGFTAKLTSAFNTVRNIILDVIKTPNKYIYSGLNIVEEVVDSLPELTDGLLSDIGSILKVPTNLLGKIVDGVMSGLGTVYDYIGSAGSTISSYENKLQQCFTSNSNNPVVVALEGFGDCIEEQVSKQSDKLDSTVGQVQDDVATLITQIDQVQNVSGLGKTVNGLIDTAQAEVKEILPTVFSVVKLALSLATAIPGYGTCSLGIVVKEPSTTYSFLKEYASCVAN